MFARGVYQTRPAAPGCITVPHHMSRVDGRQYESPIDARDLLDYAVHVRDADAHQSPLNRWLPFSAAGDDWTGEFSDRCRRVVGALIAPRESSSEFADRLAALPREDADRLIVETREENARAEGDVLWLATHVLYALAALAALALVANLLLMWRRAAAAARDADRRRLAADALAVDGAGVFQGVLSAS